MYLRYFYAVFVIHSVKNRHSFKVIVKGLDAALRCPIGLAVPAFGIRGHRAIINKGKLLFFSIPEADQLVSLEDAQAIVDMIASLGKKAA